MGFKQTLKAAILGPRAMKSHDELTAERERIKENLSLEQLVELQVELDFDEGLNQIIISEMSKSDVTVCALFGILTAISAFALDNNGKKIEAFINTLKITDPATGNGVPIKDFDTNNVFDLKRGSNHRDQLFHSGNIFKKAPADFIKPDGYSIEDLMGMGKTNYSLLEIIIKHYGLSGGMLKKAMAILKIFGVHFAKDIFTPAGLPLPFSDIFTKFIPNDTNACGYSTKNLLYDGILKEANQQLHLLNIRASDITSAMLIKVFIESYVRIVYPELDKKHRKSLISKMTVATSAMLIISQLFILCKGATDTNAVVSGGKLNMISAKMLLINSFKVCCEANRNHKIMMGVYCKRRVIIEEAMQNAKNAGILQYKQCEGAVLLRE